METSSLNMAHKYARKADNHLRYHRFDEAIESHLSVLQYLDEALAVTTMEKSLESLRLQREFHVKQIELVKIRKAQYEKYRKAVEMQHGAFEKGTQLRTQMENSRQAQIDIFQNIEETDNLLEMLSKKVTDNSDSVISSEVEGAGNIMGSKNNQLNSNVIEQLQTLNQQLHILVHELVTQLDDSITEADMLRDKVKLLEQKQTEYEKRRTTRQGNSNTTPDKDSKEMYSDLYVFRGGDLSPDANDIQELPALAPLELPNFDYLTFSCKLSDDDK